MPTARHNSDSPDSGSDATGAGQDRRPPFGGFGGSSQQLWQAGLAAFARAQAEGSKAFEALVKEGAQIQQRTQAAAGDRFSEAAQRMSGMANDIGSKASGQWNKLEGIFEERVAKALGRMGFPTAELVQELSTRVDDLTAEVAELRKRMAAKARGEGGRARASAARPAGASAKSAATRAASPRTRRPPAAD